MRTSARWVLTGKTPWPIRLSFGLLMANFVLLWVLGKLYTRVPDALHTYAIRMKGGAFHYFRPLVGQYVEISFPLHFGLMALVVLSALPYRDRFQRVEPRPAVPWGTVDFFVSLVLSAILLSAVGGFMVGIFWREGGQLLALAMTLPFLGLSLYGAEHARRQLVNPANPPFSRRLSYAVSLLLSALTLAGIAWCMQ